MKTIKTDVRGTDELMVFWGQYFPETPVCTHPDCSCVAAEVDAFFPYIDDFNRCDLHSLEVMDSRTVSTSACGHRAGRNGSIRAGSGNRRVARITWRPPR